MASRSGGRRRRGRRSPRATPHPRAWREQPYNRSVDVDFAAYARAFGALGVTVRRTAELAGAFRTAVSADCMTVIDVKTDPGVFPRFVEA